jgi:hypothetical protein
VAFVRTDLSEENFASIISLKKNQQARNNISNNYQLKLAAMKKNGGSSETSVLKIATRRHISENGILLCREYSRPIHIKGKILAKPMNCRRRIMQEGVDSVGTELREYQYQSVKCVFCSLPSHPAVMQLTSGFFRFALNF